MLSQEVPRYSIVCLKQRGVRIQYLSDSNDSVELPSTKETYTIQDDGSRYYVTDGYAFTSACDDLLSNSGSASMGENESVASGSGFGTPQKGISTYLQATSAVPAGPPPRLAEQQPPPAPTPEPVPLPKASRRSSGIKEVASLISFASASVFSSDLRPPSSSLRTRRPVASTSTAKLPRPVAT